MTVILTSILPICLIVVLGMLLSAQKFLPCSFFTQLNRLGFFLLLPALLFQKIATADAQAVGPAMRLGALLCGCSTAITLIALLWGRLIRLPDPSRRALMQASMRGNLAYAGLPIILFMYGSDCEIALLAALCLLPSVSFFNVLAVIILTPPDGSNAVERLKRTALSVLRNPLIIGCLLGVACMLSGFRLPEPAMRAVATLAQAALPCALLALGAGLSFDTLRTRIKPALVATFLKLILMPLLGYLVIRSTGMCDERLLLVSMVYLASPTAVTSYVMAEQMGADKDLAGAAVTLSTLCAMPVLAIIMLIFG